MIAAFFWLGTIAVVFNIGIITRGLGALSSNKSNPFSPAGLGLNIIRILWFSKIGVLTVLALLVALWKKPRKTQEFLKDNIIFVAAICALYPFFFLFGGGVGENAVFGLVTFSAILLFRFIGFVDKTRWIKILAIPFTCLAVVHISFFVLPEMKENKAEHDALFQEIVKSDADVVCFDNLKGRVDVDGRYVVRNMYDTIAVPSSFQSKWLCNYYGAKIRPIVPKSVYDFIFEGVVAEPHQKLNDGWIDFPGSWFFVKKLDHKPEELSDLRIKFEVDFEQATFEQKFLLIPLLQKAGRLPVSGIYIQPKRMSCVVKNTQGQYFLLALHERTLEGSLRTPIKTIAIEET